MRFEDYEGLMSPSERARAEAAAERLKKQSPHPGNWEIARQRREGKKSS